MTSRSWSRCFTESGVGQPSFVAEFALWDDRQRAAAEEVEKQLADDVTLVRVVFCDPHGLARSKTLTRDAFRTALRNGVDFSPGPFVFDTGHAVAVDFMADDPQVGVPELRGAGDFVLVPDPTTFQVLPGTEPRTAWILGDEYLRDGTPHPLSTRGVLRRVCARYAEDDLAPVIGLEVEWYLTRLLGGPLGHAGNGFGQQGPAPAVEPVNPGYQFNLDSYSDALQATTGPLAALLLDLGLPLRTIEHESGPGQVETTFSPMLALDAADAMLMFRTLVKQFCARRGLHASFMTLPRLDSFDASGWHLHQSVMSTRTEANVFAPDRPGEPLSPSGAAYADALLATARELCLLSVPTVNGYRRLDPRFTLAPTRIDRRIEDRTAMVRILGDRATTHLENRVGEPCANPYLLIGAQLHAGLGGLRAAEGRAPEAAARREGAPQGPSGPAPSDGAPHGSTLPLSLRESLEAFRAGTVGTALLGDALARCLVKLKESELARFEAWCATEGDGGGDVTEWEHREYFAVY